MGVKSLNVTEVARHFSDYVNRAVDRRERFLLCKGRKPVAELRPIPSGRRLGDLPSVLASLPRLSKREAEAFSEDIRRSREKLMREGIRDPWAS